MLLWWPDREKCYTYILIHTSSHTLQIYLHTMVSTIFDVLLQTLFERCLRRYYCNGNLLWKAPSTGILQRRRSCLQLLPLFCVIMTCRHYSLQERFFGRLSTNQEKVHHCQHRDHLWRCTDANWATIFQARMKPYSLLELKTRRHKGMLLIF